MKRLILSALVLFSSLTMRAQCISDTLNIYAFTYDGRNYEIVKENLTWVNAAACAVSRGGFLAEIDSQQEQDTIFYHVNNAGITASNTVAPDGGGASYLWIGGNDLAVEGNWIWDGDNDGTGPQLWQGTSSGSPVGGLYNNWGNEPDDWSGQDGLGFAFTNWPLGVAGEWNDVDETNALYYIIEYPGSNSIPENNGSEILIYPNPSNTQLTIFIGSSYSNQPIEIIGTNGQVVDQFIMSSALLSIDISGYAEGVYFIWSNSVNIGEFVVQR